MKKKLKSTTSFLILSTPQNYFCSFWNLFWHTSDSVKYTIPIYQFRLKDTNSKLLRAKARLLFIAQNYSTAEVNFILSLQSKIEENSTFILLSTVFLFYVIYLQIFTHCFTERCKRIGYSKTFCSALLGESFKSELQILSFFFFFLLGYGCYDRKKRRRIVSSSEKKWLENKCK